MISVVRTTLPGILQRNITKGKTGWPGKKALYYYQSVQAGKITETGAVNLTM